MKKFFKWLGIIIVGLIVISIAMGGDDEGATTTSSSSSSGSETKADEKKEEKKVYGVGQEVKVKNLTYKVNSVEESKLIEKQYLDPIKTDGKFIIVDVTVGNQDKEARFVDGEMFRLVDKDGTEFSTKSEADMYINDGDLGFFLQEINPKMSKTGKVAFEVPADATDLQLQVSSGLGWSSGKYEIINLK